MYIPCITVMAFFVYQVLEIGMSDMIEHIFVNPAVHKIHNFPGILKMEYNPNDPWVNFYAFKSGVMCTPILLLPLMVKLILLALTFKRSDKKDNNAFLWVHMILMLFLTFADMIVLYTYDQDKTKNLSPNLNIYIYRNHTWFYLTHCIAEFISLGWTVGMCYGLLFCR
ncbi:hypothetical protein EROM_040660 [Encephalitozoon romaleae SJ-2008]|uniref:Uncharacterized protein n=1 Tax=Encephalitozoon romaleae (strain SJ-2008) TaxID=1178016 RepID=I7AMB1_ENCRO|nr:hypothetical protein EROM_040660 [Encephalitozoon romaleae SJ-2008]AFN82834.1 hypothetical protein EROM_040660 [Encephalitozoon romaleae SJ-2008]